MYENLILNCLLLNYDHCCSLFSGRDSFNIFSGDLQGRINMDIKKALILKKKYLSYLFNNKRVDVDLISLARKFRKRFFKKSGKYPEDI